MQDRDFSVAEARGAATVITDSWKEEGCALLPLVLTPVAALEQLQLEGSESFNSGTPFPTTPPSHLLTAPLHFLLLQKDYLGLVKRERHKPWSVSTASTSSNQPGSPA